MNFHLFPVNMGVLSYASWKVITPYLGALILTIYYLAFDEPKSTINRSVLWGVLGLFALSIVGVALPYLHKPFLIKLALTRASVLLLFFTIVYTTSGLWKDVSSQKFLGSAVAAILLVMPFISRPLDATSVVTRNLTCRFNNFVKAKSL